MPGRGELQAGTHKKKSAEVCPKPQTGRSTISRSLKEKKKDAKRQKEKRVVSLLFR
jgi:hypothetical protein